MNDTRYILKEFLYFFLIKKFLVCFAFVDSRVLILKLDVFAQKIQEVIQQLESWLSTSIFKCTLLFDYHQAFWEIIY